MYHLQGMTTLLCEQEQRFDVLVDTYCRMSRMQGPLIKGRIEEIVSMQPAEVKRSFLITHERTSACISGLGVWICRAMDELDADSMVDFADVSVEFLSTYPMASARFPLAATVRIRGVPTIFLSCSRVLKTAEVWIQRLLEIDVKPLSHAQAFCGGLALAFPNTATVESDFSVIGVEKNDYRKSLTDFSLEGVLH
eukprot:IDg1790t1